MAVIDSELPDTSPQFSFDGRRLVFQSMRSGVSEVWVSDANGAHAVRLTDGRGANLGNPRWSPDGKLIAFEWHPHQKAEIYVMSADGGGSPRRLVADDNQNSMPAWSHDGKYVYFSVTAENRSELRKIPVAGGRSELVLPNEALAPSESPDGKYLYYFRSSGEVWHTAIENGSLASRESRDIATLQPQDWGNWAPANDGIYFIQRRNDESAAIEFQPLAGSPRILYVLPKPPVYGGGGIAVAPDGKTILFAQVDQDDANIFVQ